MYLKQKADQASARDIAARMKVIDYELMAIASGPGCALTLKAADQVARLQRSLRALRFQIEIEAGIDLDGLRPAPGGRSPTLVPFRGPARGGKRKICGK